MNQGWVGETGQPPETSWTPHTYPNYSEPPHGPHQSYIYDPQYMPPSQGQSSTAVTTAWPNSGANANLYNHSIPNNYQQGAQTAHLAASPPVGHPQPPGASSAALPFHLATAGINPKECPICLKRTDRADRAETCYNMHLGLKPYTCSGDCSRQTWSVMPWKL